ncbi:hypothetical protein GGR52DRAFT_537453 [Hypoxylon sp. FL1284]|nr:hypothetical protein GGR52DRAFT_537453 [Hypoxylon sp. FL1284]
MGLPSLNSTITSCLLALASLGIPMVVRFLIVVAIVSVRDLRRRIRLFVAEQFLVEVDGYFETAYQTHYLGASWLVPHTHRPRLSRYMDDRMFGDSQSQMLPTHCLLLLTPLQVMRRRPESTRKNSFAQASKGLFVKAGLPVYPASCHTRMQDGMDAHWLKTCR